MHFVKTRLHDGRLQPLHEVLNMKHVSLKHRNIISEPSIARANKKSMHTYSVPGISVKSIR